MSEITMPVSQFQVQPATPKPMGPKSTFIYCSSCNKKNHTVVLKKHKAIAWLSCLLLCLGGCICGCCLIPFHMDSCSNIEHMCPECKAFLGQYRP
ncbi:lipopolysaccharide-induced tumor necrosis factor-alpha factor homolog [Melanaphis sacchari]|uniref:lipopolysaccharide-induced tumor necrosis factor-alpha factor homolog n=1 Tax=Melanaphis sacchari TaxID=742174 RepID=UPI000DC153D3|nr:lipopolysaccharide-induced tumor necrosis factor-alpha factor homolog [Melanaphis sacchari]XP_025200921.1 lipopolysaccharide-induced tumor necrosis factor-alpha factor homolog [Melanaphis sacchari]XP_025202743.1 lipopolysaccharide-induced tumor necrosis factor-alpha factor homolog [Melanaphis sacchari]XP_025202802.1 lipopolysaccharide-induced tumor necrosis factor-alpha factor homolog [Melanaphis sacchari]